MLPGGAPCEDGSAQVGAARYAEGSFTSTMRAGERVLLLRQLDSEHVTRCAAFDEHGLPVLEMRDRLGAESHALDRYDFSHALPVLLIFDIDVCDSPMIAYNSWVAPAQGIGPRAESHRFEYRQGHQSRMKTPGLQGPGVSIARLTDNTATGLRHPAVLDRVGGVGDGGSALRDGSRAAPSSRSIAGERRHGGLVSRLLVGQLEQNEGASCRNMRARPSRWRSPPAARRPACPPAKPAERSRRWRLLCTPPRLLVARARFREDKVVANGAREQVRLLRHETSTWAQARGGYAANVVDTSMAPLSTSQKRMNSLSRVDFSDPERPAMRTT